MVKALGLLIFLAGLGVALKEGFHWVNYTNMTPIQKLQSTWDKDTHQLLSTPYFHKGISTLKSVEFIGTDGATLSWATKLKAPFETSDQGQHHLEILLLSWQEEGSLWVIVQYDLYDIATKNLLWEKGRTYQLK